MGSCPFHNIDTISQFDALNPAARENPWLYYDWLRDDVKRSVYPLPHEKNFFMIHRYEDVRAVLSNPVTYSSKIIPTRKGLFFVLMDGDDHKRIRSVAGEVFTQKNLIHFQPQLQRLIDETTEKIVNSGEVELFDAWADRIPLATLSLLFGMDTSVDDIRKMHDQNIAINKALFVTGGTGPRRKTNPDAYEKLLISFSLMRNTGKIIRLGRLIGASGIKELREMLMPAKGNHNIPRPDFKAIPSAVGPLLELLIGFAEKLKLEGDSKEGDDNVLNIFRQAIRNGEVTLTEMVMTSAFIIFAGYETTSSLLSNCVVHLSRHPEVLKRLKEHPDQLDDFIQESLRFYTPVGRFLRKTTIDTTLHGVKIPKDSIVLVMNGAANTDPMKFNNGCEFDINRQNSSQHLSFGKGSHFCIGAPLALQQVTIALRSLITKVGKISINTSQPLQMVVDRDNGILRYEKLQVNFQSAQSESGGNTPF